MAKLPGEHKYDRQERLRQPVKVPAKGKGTRNQSRYWWARSRNGWRRWRRARYGTAERARRATAWMGAEYECVVCHRRVLYRHAERHNWQHAAMGETARKLKPISPEERAQQRPTTPVPRQPSATKAKAKAQKTGGAPVPPPDPKPPATVTPITKRRPWQRPVDDLEDDMAGRPRRSGTNGSSAGGGGTPGVAASSPAAAFLNGVKAWCEYRPETVSDLRAHLLGMDAAMGQAADLFHQFAAEAIVATKIHPAVAQPIDAAADDVAAIRHRFSEAYARFEAIYADRLAYERSTDKPKPDEKIFSDVG
jgi:hypothetical protein